jgi:hypothetical protein
VVGLEFTIGVNRGSRDGRQEQHVAELNAAGINLWRRNIETNLEKYRRFCIGSGGGVFSQDLPLISALTTLRFALTNVLM